MDGVKRRELLMSKSWVQAVGVVILFGFFVLGLLAYQTYTGEPPIPARMVDPAGHIVFTHDDVVAGQETFLRNGLMEYGSIFGHGAYSPRSGLFSATAATQSGTLKVAETQLVTRIRAIGIVDCDVRAAKV